MNQRTAPPSGLLFPVRHEEIVMTGGVVRVTVYRFSARPARDPEASDETTGTSWRRRLVAWLASRI